MVHSTCNRFLCTMATIHGKIVKPTVLLCTSLLGLLCFTATLCSFPLDSIILNTIDHTLGNKCNNIIRPLPPASLLGLAPTHCAMATPFDQTPLHTVGLRRVTRFGRASQP